MKYYTAFLPSLIPGALHVTHKYLGVQTDEKLEEVCATIERYFQIKQESIRDIDFSIRTFFGPHHDVPVLLPLPETPGKAFKPKLRAMLDGFAKDAFGDYRPHISTRQESIKFRVNYYAVMHKDRVVKSWAIT